MPKVRRVSRDKTRDYTNSRTLQNGYTLQKAANAGSQASVANDAIVSNAQVGVSFTVRDVLGWQLEGKGKGRSAKTMSDHLESLVGKGFLVAVCHYEVVPGAIGQ